MIFISLSFEPVRFYFFVLKQCCGNGIFLLLRNCVAETIQGFLPHFSKFFCRLQSTILKGNLSIINLGPDFDFKKIVKSKISVLALVKFSGIA
jgi:hypothetical protein